MPEILFEYIELKFSDLPEDCITPEFMDGVEQSLGFKIYKCEKHIEYIENSVFNAVLKYLPQN